MEESLRCGARTLNLSRIHVMGVLNVTPDSFSDGGRFYAASDLDKTRNLALRHAEQMCAEGASIIDVGGESTRPGSVTPDTQEELDRVLPVVERLAKDFDAVISVDTSNPALMREAIALGAGMINDIRALRREGALEAVAGTDAAVCLMHMQGEPGSMQDDPVYDDVVADVTYFLGERLQACADAGIDASRVVLDPGFGFGKTLAHNLSLLAHLDAFAALKQPLLVGMSRKSMIGTVLDQNVDQRLYGSLAVATVAAMRGANMIRVHDVAATVDCVRMVEAVAHAE